MVFKKEDLILNFDRIRQDVTTFIRGNPLITAGIGLGAPLAIIGITKAVRRRKKKAKAVSKTRRKRKRKVARRKTRRVVRKKRKKVTHSSPRHRGHKMVTFTTKDGKKVRFKVARKPHIHKRRR